MAFIFDTSKGETPQELERRRQLAEALIARNAGRWARTPAEGWSQIGQALAGKIMQKRAEGKLRAGQEGVGRSSRALMESLMGGGAAPGPISNPEMGAMTGGGGTPALAGSGGAGIQPTSAPAAAARSGIDPAGKSPYDIASSLIGKGEVPDRATLSDFVKNGGQNLAMWRCSRAVIRTGGKATSGFTIAGTRMDRSMFLAATKATG